MQQFVIRRVVIRGRFNMDAKTDSQEEPSDKKPSPTPTPTPNTEKSSLVTMTEKPTQSQEPNKKGKRRPPRVPWKKPKDMPRRPLSTYNIFFREQREAMMSAAAAETGAAAAPTTTKRSRKRSGKSLGIGFANLARTIAANWKELDSESRAPYEGVAASEKERYDQEMLVWRAKQKEGKDKEASTSSSGEPDEALVTGMVKMDTEDSTHSEEDAEAYDASRVSPLPVTSSSRTVSQPLAVLESPNKSSRLDYAARRGSGFTPIRVPDLYGRSDPRVDPIQYHPRTYTSSISGGMEAYPHHLHQYDSALGLGGYSYMEPWSGDMEGLGQGLRHHPYHLQGHPQVERRYTWSRAVHTTDSYQAAAAQRYRTALPTTATSRLYPDAWFEAEATPRNTAPAHTGTVESNNPGSKLYPDTWFEVHQAPGDDAGDDPIEPIRYSPGGDFTGKLLAGNKSPPQRTPSSSLLKAGGSLGAAEGKLAYDKQVGVSRSLNELASDTTRTGHSTSRRGSNPIVENPLQTPGLQLDEETVDFLTKLPFNNSSSETNSEE
jgi:hypothetical protein